MVTTISASIGGEDGTGKQGTMVRTNGIYQHLYAFSDNAEGMVVSYGYPPEPTPLPADPPSQPEQEPVVSQATVEAGSAEATICGVWTTVSCSYILRVARCESGSDYYSTREEGYYIGTFQLDPNLHGGRFLAHGWNIWTDGQDIYKNSVVAYELYLDNGMAPWPVCRYA